MSLHSLCPPPDIAHQDAAPDQNRARSLTAMAAWVAHLTRDARQMLPCGIDGHTLPAAETYQTKVLAAWLIGENATIATTPAEARLTLLDITVASKTFDLDLVDAWVAGAMTLATTLTHIAEDPRS